MKTSLSRIKGAEAAGNSTGSHSSTRDRVLEVACKCFAEAGFHGTQLREICKRAGTNVAGVYYHFHSKEGLYQAVFMEAGRQLFDCGEGLVASPQVPAQERMFKLVESLLKKLTIQGAWIAKLLVRELVNQPCGARYCAVPGLEQNFVMLYCAMRELHGPGVNSEAIRLRTLSLIGECVLYSLADETVEDPWSPLAARLPNRASLARLITQRSLGSLEMNRNQPETLGANFS
jgi:AcrR family transcriptional regulator